MKLRKLKELINSIPEKDLDNELMYNSETQSLSGVVSGLKKAKQDLYFDGEDDPSRLLTKKQLKEELGLDAEEIAEYTVEIPKGGYYIEF